MRKFLTVLSSILAVASAQDQLSILIGDIQSGPVTYYSPEAYSFYTRKGHQISPQPPKENAVRCYLAAIKLGNMGNAAMPAVPVLIQNFPKAVHVSEVSNVQYTGEGLFEDWVQTYIMTEKNKFLLSSPFLDYNSISICEQYIETVHDVQFLNDNPRAGNVPAGTIVNITVTLTLNMATCALEKITGISLGNDQSAWNSWWEQSGNAALPASSEVAAVVTSPALASGQSFSEIVAKGKYRMSLTTGDELVGIVESKDDTSLILETLDGKPYAFRHSLISRYELLELPEVKKAKQAPAPVKSPQVISFDALRQKSSENPLLEVSIKNGSVFKGRLFSIDAEMLQIIIEKSRLPFSRDVINKLMILPEQKTPDTVRKMQGPFDTVFVKNPQTDDWGRAQPDLVYEGKIRKEDAQTVTIELPDGKQEKLSRSTIKRITRHSSDSFDEPIKKYAKPLFCPDDMFLVDMPPGKQGKPYFKVCVDRYEFPNIKDTRPMGNVSYDQAKQYCEQKGKRLCTAQEWQWACSGLEGYTYPYGWNVEEQKCNADTRAVETSGSRHNCVSKFGGYDMTGNIFEWVTGNKAEPMLMGGPYSKCQTVSPGVGGSAKPQTGLRCCKSN
ncbi:MAG: formylglycine-generating enzyme family protein [Fibrobacter sp.]|nr:formylglycine-generating enzyme family protein [Fibrobacter sp.]